MATYVYDDFRVTFTPRAEGAFDVRAIDAAGGTTTEVFSVPLSAAELERAVMQFARGRSRRPTRRATAPTVASPTVDAPPILRDVGGEGPPSMDAEELGAALADALFGGDVGIAYDHARQVAEGRGHGIRLTLSLAGAPELLSVPWEFLYRRPRFLASQRRSPVVRLLECGSLTAPPVIDEAVRILGIVASPNDLSPLDVADERKRVEQAIATVAATERVQLDWLEPATPRRLRQALRDGNYHVLHYVGHGDFTPAGEGVLYLEDGDDGGSIEVDETLFANLLADQNVLRLVVLNSCEGARTTLTDPYAGVATTLIQLGVPAVVAMQFEISDRAAVVFAEELYTNLIGRQDPIDAAVAEARKAIYSEVDKVEWATPVLFVRDPDVELFRFEVPLPALPPPPPPGDPAAPAEAPRHSRARLATFAGLVGLVALVGIIVGLRSCGGDDENVTPTTAPVTTPALAWPSLNVGAEGLAVEVVQRLLTARGFPVEATGFFDDATLAAVEELEAATNIPVDGEVGRVTWQQLVAPVRRGDTGEDVVAAQLMLAANGLDIEADGRFGLDTQDAVVRLQRQHDLAVDGIVDVDTWEALLAGATS